MTATLNHTRKVIDPEIIEGLQGHTTGFAVPSYVIDAPGGGGKIPLIPNHVISQGYGNDSRRIWNSFAGKQPDGLHISERAELLDYIKRHFHSGDVILFKASGSMHMDQIVRSAFPISFLINRITYERKTLRWLVKTI